MALPPSLPDPEDELPVPKEEHPAASLVRIGIGVAIGMTLLWVVSPKVIRCGKSADRTERINHLKSIGLALNSFGAEYNDFPNAATAASVKAATHTPLTLGSGSSNQLFRQLLATGIAQESLFHTGVPNGEGADGNFSDDAHALAPGECGYAYVAGLNGSNPPDTPVLFWPVIPGTMTFDTKLAKDSALMLTLDNQVSAVRISASGQGRIGGMDLFDPRQPFWHGKAPDLRWPE